MAVKFKGAGYYGTIYTPIDHQKFKVFEKFIGCQYITDHAKITVVSRISEHLWEPTKLTDIRKIPLSLNNPEAFKEFVKKGEMLFFKRAIQNGDLEIIEILADYRPRNVFNFSTSMKIFQSLDFDDLIKLITKYPQHIAPYAPELRTKHFRELSEETIYIMLSKNASLLEKLAYHHENKDFKLTQKMCDIALNRSGTVISYIPPEFLNEDSLFKAAQKAPSILAKIPKEMLNSRTLLKLTLMDQKYHKYFKDRR
jgi:hypothetical protein